MSLGKDFERQMKKATNEELKKTSGEAQQKLDRAYQRLEGKPPDQVRRSLKRELKGTILEGEEETFVQAISEGERVKLDDRKFKV